MLSTVSELLGKKYEVPLYVKQSDVLLAVVEGLG